MKGFHRFGVQELTRLEQREILGGEGFWEGVGYYMGRAVGWFFEALEEAGEGIRDDYQDRCPTPFAVECLPLH